MPDLRPLVVIPAVMLVVVVAGCAPAGRHANSDTLPDAVRMPYGLRSTCSGLLAVGPASVMNSLVPIGERRVVVSPLHDALRVLPNARYRYAVGFIFACRLASSHRAVATVTAWIRVTAGRTSVSVAGMTSGGATASSVFDSAVIEVGQHWRRVVLRGPMRLDRNTLALTVEIPPSSAPLDVSRLRIAT